MDRYLLILLPGAMRSEDRLLPKSQVTIDFYSPSKDSALTLEQRRYLPDALRCTVAGEAAQIYPFAFPCAFDADWTSLDALGNWQGVNVYEDVPYGEDEPLTRSVLTQCVALADGSVYVTRQPGAGNVLLVRRLPVRAPAEWIAEQARLAADRAELVPTESHSG